MLLWQIKTKNPVIFFLIADCFLHVDIQLHVVYFYFQTAKKLFIGFFKDVVQGSKGYLAMLSLQTPLLVSMCSKKKGN